MLPLLFQLGFWPQPAAFGSADLRLGDRLHDGAAMSATLLRLLGFRRLMFSNAIVVAFVMAGFTLLRPSTPTWIILAYVMMFGVSAHHAVQYSNMLAYSEIPPARLSRSTSLGARCSN